MTLVTKAGSKFGLMAKAETVYGTAVSLTPATDGVRLLKEAGVKVMEFYDGIRPGKAPGTYGRLQKVGTEGRFAELQLEQEVAGYGAAYSASNAPVPHLQLLANGWKAVVVTTGGSESYTYTPGDDADFTSICLESYEYGEKYAVQGVLGEGVDIKCDLGKIATITSKCRGIMAAVQSDASPVLPVGLAYNSTIGAKATAMNLTMLTATGVAFAPVRVQSFSLKQKTGLTDRAYDNVNARHGGFFFGKQREFQLEVLIEMPALAPSVVTTATTFNPRLMMEAGSLTTLALAIGATQYKKWSIAAAGAQLAAEPRELKGAVVMTKLLFDLMPSSEVANDEVTLLFN